MNILKNLVYEYIQRKDFFIQLLLEHLFISTMAITIATIIGVVLGIIISEYRKIANVILTITNIIYTIPTIAMLGILISFSGVGNKSAIIALIIYGLLPMVRNTYTGIISIDTNIIESAIGMGTNKLQLYYKVKLPLAFPVIFSGFRTMSVMTISLCGMASFIGAGGLGVVIYRGITTNNSVLTIAGSLLIVLTALSADFVFSKIEKYIKIPKARRGKNYFIKYVLPILYLAIIFVPVLFSNAKNNQIIIATKPQTEQFILAEMMKILIEDNMDVKVTIVKGVNGGTSNIHAGMLNGEFDMYPEYTGTAWNYILKNDFITDNDELFSILSQQYYDDYNFKWVGLYGFNNTYTLAVKEEFAAKNNLETFTDLARISSGLSFGAEYDFFEREDGYIGLVNTYGFNFNRTMDLDIGLKFEAVNLDRVDVINAFSSDGMLKAYNLKILKDDKRFFKDYYAGTVVRNEVLEMYPKLEEVLFKLDGIITDSDMSAMNFDVENKKIHERDVAVEFLRRAGVYG